MLRSLDLSFNEFERDPESNIFNIDPFENEFLIIFLILTYNYEKSLLTFF